MRELKRATKTLPWRRRLEARQEAVEQARQAELMQRAMRSAEQAALSTQIAARSTRPSSGC